MIMMTATALTFPIALIMALGTILTMLRGYGSKMMAALRMDPYIPQSAAPPPSVRMVSRVASRPTTRAPTPLTLAA